MRFSVPQFIEFEDKVFGPLTFKQGLYVGGALGFAVFLYTEFGFFSTVIFGAPIGILAFALAFVKINERPFISSLYAAVFYTLRNKLYLWKKGVGKHHAAAHAAAASAAPTRPLTPHLTQSRLKELAWNLDTQESGEQPS